MRYLHLPTRRAQLVGKWTPRKLHPALWLDAGRTSTALEQGMAAQFASATSEHLSIADNAALSTGDIDFTLCAWVRLDDQAAARTVLGKYENLQKEYVIDVVASRFRFIVSNDGSADVVLNADTLGAPSNATWYFVVAWHDSVANTINIQVNNGTADSAAHTTGVRDGTAAFAIGSLTLNGSNYMNGRIQCVGLAKSVLSAAQRTALYNNGVALAYDQLPPDLQALMTAYWNLDEPSGTRNDSASTNHLTDNNTVTTNPGIANNAVGTFDDVSGNGRSPTQATQANKYRLVRSALNGRPVVRLDGSNDYGTFTAANLGTANSLVLAYRPRVALTASLAVLVGNASGEYLLALDQTNLYYKPAATVAAVSVAHGGLSANTAYVISLVRDGTSVSFYVNGTQAGTTQTLGSNDALSIGSVGAYSDATSPAEGDLEECMVVDRPLSTNERKRAERYAGRRIAVAVS